MLWERKGNWASVRDFILGTGGVDGGPVSEEELLSPQGEAPEKIPGMAEAAAQLKDSVINGGGKVVIVGDYDSDGMNAAAILVKLFRFFHIEPAYIIPRRMTDGYGMAEDLVGKIEPGSTVITVDNGITANDAIAKLKDKGCFVIVMDHHQQAEELPRADIIVDPHVFAADGGFIHYCGAGLAAQLAFLMTEPYKDSPDTEKFRKEVTVHAGIATVTDVVPVLGQNRLFVQDALYLMNYKCHSLSPSLTALRDAVRDEHLTEDSFGFNIGPILNAAPRLYDRGGESVMKALLCQDFYQASEYMSKMVSINNARKNIVRQTMVVIEKTIEEQHLLAKGAPLFIYQPDIPEGVIGIVAGQLGERYHIPAFVFTDEKRTGGKALRKGSARAGKSNVDLTGAIERARDICVTCGGHVGAAGLTVEASRFEELEAAVRGALAGQVTGEASDCLFYDVECKPKDVVAATYEQESFAPFGASQQRPMVLVRNISLGGTSPYRLVGVNQQSVVMQSTDGFKLFAPSMADRFSELPYPYRIDAVGTLNINMFKGQEQDELFIKDFKPAK